MQQKTFDELYKSYIQAIFAYLVSLCQDYHLAEDLVNETFFRAYLCLEDCHTAKVKPWLYKVAYHVYIDFRRKHSRIVLKENGFFEQRTKTRNLEELIIINEQLHEVDQIIACLPDNQKQAILLADFHGLQYKEAAEIMQVSVGHFKVLLFRARQKVRTESKEGE